MDMQNIPPVAELDVLSDDAFRAVARRFVELNYPPELRNPPKRLHWSENSVWYLTLAKAGWLCAGWPREYGGMGLSPSKQIIVMEEFERHGCARTNDHGVVMVGPLLINHGSQFQKNFFLPGILSGDHVWCQGYSEPNSGSDLASLRTEAVLDGDHYVVNGQKTWTTLGNDANWMYMLVRTDKTAKKQQGISFLLVPMDTPGITVRPIINLDMHDEFCEVFFDNVRVPKEYLVGGVNNGWTIAKAQLGFERIYIGSPKMSSFALLRLKQLAERMGVWDEVDFQDRYAHLRLDLADLTALYERFVAQLRRGETLGPDVSMLKVFQTELFQRITDEMLAISGENAGLLDPMEGNRELHPAGLFINARPTTIYGGSSEIQRGILAKNVLGLP